jgi:general secretion pathway protein N
VSAARTRPRRALPLLLAVAVAALVGVNGWVLQLDPASAPAAAGAAPAQSAAAHTLAAPYQNRELSEYEETVRRPVFTASRRPYAPPAPAPPPPAAAPEPERLPAELRLLGVLIDADRRQVLLRTKQQPAGRWLKEGDSIEGWQLRSILADGAVLANRARSHELRLYPGADAGRVSQTTRP